MMTDKFETHLFSYSHDGKQWEIEILAKDADDARVRIGKLAYAHYDGIHIATVPASMGPLVRLVVWLKNFVKY